MIARIALPKNFSFDAVVRSHGWYDLPPFSYDRERGILKTVVVVESRPLTPALSRRERGKGAPLTPAFPRGEREKGAASITFRAHKGYLEAESENLDGKTLRRATIRVFSLDLDFRQFAQSVQSDPALSAALSRGGGRMLRAPSVFEDAVKMLLTTNCSWEATRGMVTRLIALAGQGGAFPTPDAIASFSAPSLKAKVRCGYRAKALALFARRVARGAIDVGGWEDPRVLAGEIRRAILAEHGFGPYAAEGLLRIFGRHEYLALDSWVRQQYRRLYPGPARTADGSMARRYARHGPYRGLALWLDLTREWHEENKAVWP